MASEIILHTYQICLNFLQPTSHPDAEEGNNTIHCPPTYNTTVDIYEQCVSLLLLDWSTACRVEDTFFATYNIYIDIHIDTYMFEQNYYKI